MPRWTPTGEGKGWARGKTAAVDDRIARSAAAKRGQPHRTYRGVPLYRSLDWTDELAYVLGLLATDGCLVSDQRHIDFTSGDRELCQTLLDCLHRQVRIGEVRTRTGGTTFRVQLGDVSLYRWLLERGLTSRKSLTMGALDVPERHVYALARGLLDGDGSILNYRYAGTGKAKGKSYETIVTCFSSASRPHLEWLRGRLEPLLGFRGGLGKARQESGNYMYRLAYAKRASLELRGCPSCRRTSGGPLSLC